MSCRANPYALMNDEELKQCLREQFNEGVYFGIVQKTCPDLAHALDRHGLAKKLCTLNRRKEELSKIPQTEIIDYIKKYYLHCPPSDIRQQEFNLFTYLQNTTADDKNGKSLLQYLLDEKILTHGEKIHRVHKRHSIRWTHLNGGIKSPYGKYEAYWRRRH
jgi:hypothetical protein